jgi:hypothetical protein
VPVFGGWIGPSRDTGINLIPSGGRGRGGELLFCDLSLKRADQPLLDALRHGLGVHTLEDLQRAASRVANDPAIGTFVHVALNLTAEAGVNRLVKKVAQLL